MPIAVAIAACSSGSPTKTGGDSIGTGGAGAVGVQPTPTGASGTVGLNAAGRGTSGIGVPAGTAGRVGATAGTSAPAGAGTGAVGPVAGSGTVPSSTAGSSGAAVGGNNPGAGGATAGGAPTAMAGMGAPPIVAGEACTPPPMGAAVTDYGAKGPLDVMTVSNTGPSNQYTMFRPKTLGMGGFMHPPVTWGNGVTTTPDLYTALLTTVASHGFVIIASNSTGVTAQDVQSGLEWLIMQNDADGDLKGKLAVKCAGAIGYSMGGGAAVGAAAHPNVIATVSMHGLQGDANKLHGPLLLMTSTNDGFVTKDGFVKPTYDGSTKVPTIMATEDVPGTPDFSGHLLPLGDSGNERAPLVAWLRLFIYGDTGAKTWFYGPDCGLCKAPWTDIQRKNAMW